jgi:outer membrane protein TolC
LSTDRQNLIDQQINRRNAAIKLSQYLNIEQGEDLTTNSDQMNKIRLVSQRLGPAELLKVAIDNRPELKQYQQLRLAAKRQINIELSHLLPTFDFNGDIFGVGETLSPSTRTVTTNTIGIAAGGGSVVAAPITLNLNRRIGGIWRIGYNLSWQFEGIGTVASANTYNAKLLARQAQLQQQQILNQVITDVRQSYLSTLSSENLIQEATAKVKSATEELRLAQLRFQHGLGKNIDVLRAQQDHTSALIDKAQALQKFDIAQVQLLRDIGVLSINTITARTPFNG